MPKRLANEAGLADRDGKSQSTPQAGSDSAPPSRPAERQILKLNKAAKPTPPPSSESSDPPRMSLFAGAALFPTVTQNVAGKEDSPSDSSDTGEWPVKRARTTDPASFSAGFAWGSGAASGASSAAATTAGAAASSPTPPSIAFTNPFIRPAGAAAPSAGGGEGKGTGASASPQAAAVFGLSVSKPASGGTPLSFQDVLRAEKAGEVEKGEAAATPQLGADDVAETPGQTGEEGDRVVHSARARLFERNREKEGWLSRGTGQVKLLKSAEEGGANHARRRPRLVMRTEGTLKVVLNVVLFSKMHVSAADEKTVRIVAMKDDAVFTLLLRLGTTEGAQSLKNAIQAQVTLLEQAEAKEEAKKEDDDKKEA